MTNWELFCLTRVISSTPFLHPHLDFFAQSKLAQTSGVYNGDPYRVYFRSLKGTDHGGGGGSSIVKVPGDVPPARVYFFGLLV